MPSSFWQTLGSARMTAAVRRPRRLTVEALEDRVTPAIQRIVALSVEAGAPPVVPVFDALTLQPKFTIQAFENSFTGGVRVAVGDVTGDGVEDVIAGAGPGGGAVLKVFSGADGGLVRTTPAGDSSNRGGASVAAADFDGDGFADVVVGAVSGGRELVQVLKGTTGAVLKEFRPFEAPIDGVTVAAGDFNGDGTPDVVVGAGVGGAPRATALDFGTGGVLLNVFAFESTARGGVQVAAGDLDGDGRAEVVAAPGRGGGPRIVTFAGGTGAPAASFFAYEAAARNGVQVSVFDLDRNGTNDVVTANGPGRTPDVKGFDGRTLAPIAAGPFAAGLPAQGVGARPSVAGVTPAAGRATGGTVVTITGRGFTGATAVTVRGVAASAFTVDSDSQITATTPAGTRGAADVAVATRAGTATAAGAFTYLRPAAVVLLPTGLSVYSADTGTFTPIPGVAPADVQAYGVDAAGVVYFDRGTNGGLFRFDPAAGRKAVIFAADVTALAVSGDGTVYFAVPTGAADLLGTYRLAPGSTGPTRITAEVATSLVVSGNGVVVGQFPSAFQLYDPVTGTFSVVSPAAIGSGFDITPDGNTVYATVGGNLFRFDRTAGGGVGAGEQVSTGLNVVSISTADDRYLYLDLSVNGTYQYDADTRMLTRIDTRNPVFVVGAPNGTAYFDYAGNGGTVGYDPATGVFTTLSTNANAFFGPDDVDTASNLYLDYNADGLFRYDPTAAAVPNAPRAGVQISPDNPTSTVANG